MRTRIFMLTVMLVAGSITVQAQFLKKLKDKVSVAADRKINSTVDKAINKTTDKVVDSAAGRVEKMAGDVGKKKKDKKSTSRRNSQNKSLPETENPVVQDSTASK